MPTGKFDISMSILKDQPLFVLVTGYLSKHIQLEGLFCFEWNVNCGGEHLLNYAVAYYAI